MRQQRTIPVDGNYRRIGGSAAHGEYTAHHSRHELILLALQGNVGLPPTIEVDKFAQVSAATPSSRDIYMEASPFPPLSLAPLRSLR